MKKCVLPISLLTCLLFSSCDLVTDVINQQQLGDGTVYYWITSDADTYVECTNTGGGCTGGDFDHSGYDFVTVAHSQTSIKRTYVNFPKVSFPPGTVIEEAYFEMYHSGKNEDGKRDDILLDVNRVHRDWNAGQLTYANQPIPTGNGGEVSMKLESQNWSGTTDIHTQMQDDLMGSTNFQGFLVSIQSWDPVYEKGFYSGNHRSRTLTDLGLAPRLLLRVKLPDGYTTDNVTVGPGHADGNSNYVGFRYRTGTGWP
ncbi:MAG TPA: DNRLRE domain-containing protein, partial [Saprospiraceae bacterium]|nr:DNRLRE domain-containing protein [Saprospiraceae bacterium]